MLSCLTMTVCVMRSFDPDSNLSHRFHLPWKLNETNIQRESFLDGMPVAQDKITLHSAREMLFGHQLSSYWGVVKYLDGNGAVTRDGCVPVQKFTFRWLFFDMTQFSVSSIISRAFICSWLCSLETYLKVIHYSSFKMQPGFFQCRSPVSFALIFSFSHYTFRAEHKVVSNPRGSSVFSNCPETPALKINRHLQHLKRKETTVATEKLKMPSPVR